jgi:hypothetical protein
MSIAMTRSGVAMALPSALLSALLALLAGTRSAEARSQALLPYPLGEVWPTAVRYLRIDRAAVLREKDADSGYILFDLPEGQKTFKGSLEFVRTSDAEERESTRLVINLPDLPRHFEMSLLDKLTAKVKDEYGSPASGPPRRPPPETGKSSRPPAPDAGVLPRPTQGELPRPERRP